MKVLTALLITLSIALVVYLATLLPLYILGLLAFLVIFGEVYSIVNEFYDRY